MRLQKDGSVHEKVGLGVDSLFAAMSPSNSSTTFVHLLLEVIVSQEKDRILAMHDVLGILEEQLDVLPSNHMLIALAIISSGDVDGFGR